MTLRLFPAPRGRRMLAGAAGILACLALVACATKQFEPDFTTYSEAYAQNQNWQMLLNIARLDQGYPSYFLAIGAIHLLRNQTGSLQGAGTMSRTAGQTVTSTVTRTVSNVLSGSLTPNASTNVQPSFDFIPINSTEAAQQLLAPISTDAFDTLYQQGWPVDELLRVMVERIEVAYYGNNEKEDIHLALTNSPTRADNWKLFARFLRACEVVRELQKKGGLRLVTEYAPAKASGTADQGVYVVPGESAAGGGGPAAGGKGGGAKGRAGAQAADAGSSSADAKTGKAAPERQLVYRFEADRNILDLVLADLSNDPVFRMAGVEDQAEAARMREMVAQVKAPVEGDPMWNFSEVFKVLTVTPASTAENGKPEAGQPPEGQRPKPGTVHTTLILRSFRNMLDAVAQEQRSWDRLAGDPSLHFLDYVPVRQRHPVLRTDWSAQPGALLPPVISVSFHGRRYEITDPKDGDPLDVDSRWNRDVFRLLIDLSAQVSVDITKFQRPVLELSQ